TGGAEVGTRIGPYQLVRVIGEGGMGTVYLAEQEQPVRRQVALKIIKPGMGSAEVITRFEAERQALARMDHPSIAKVLDGGIAEVHGARPFFVMERVDGPPLTTFCAERRLSHRDRLRLFVSVCQAVQHAHQKGVIHRDLKPSNVLVATYDGVPTPKVIDFGVAKAIDQPLTDRTLETGLGALVGTPEYMSPEQAQLNAADIDTRSDIYALGVVLYEVLTGTTPLTRDRVRGSNLLDVLRLIRDEEPPKPSRRLADLRRQPGGDTTAGGPTRIDLHVPRCYELDWIVMKCLEKDRSRRYETATGLAQDLEHYLADEPVSASPPSSWYRVRKFARRYRRPLATASAFAVLLLAAAGVSIGLAVRARVAEREAKESEERTRQERDKVMAAMAEADDAGAIEREVRRFLQDDVLRQAGSTAQADWGTPPNPKLTVREALDRAAARIGDRFAGRPLVEAGVRLAIGDAYRAVGEAKLAIPHLERALALRREHRAPTHIEVIAAADHLAGAYYQAGRPTEALALLLEMAQRINGDAGPNLELSMAVVSAAFHTSSLKDAIRLHELTLERQKKVWGPNHKDTLESMASLGMGYQFAGRFDDMAAILEDAVARMTATLGDEHPRTLSTMGLLGEAYTISDQAAKGVLVRERVVRLLEAQQGNDHPSTLTAMVGLGVAYRMAGRSADGVALLEDAFARSRRKYGDDHRETLAIELALCPAYEAVGQPDRAEALYRDLVARRRAGPISGHLEDAVAITNLADLLMRQHRPAEAEPLFREALTIRENRFPDDWKTAQLRSKLAEALTALMRYADAEPLLLAALPVLERHVRETGGLGPPAARAAALRRLIRLYDAWGKPERAMEWRKKAAAVKAPAATN
ncbi:MAG TPA: serine/threonine-protein kinase, partial [Gemmataceae bacterium]|nr:serine/threonine-protein kinase [Gemmataceae bacterium]